MSTLRPDVKQHQNALPSAEPSRSDGSDVHSKERAANAKGKDSSSAAQDGPPMPPPELSRFRSESAPLQAKPSPPTAPPVGRRSQSEPVIGSAPGGQKADAGSQQVATAKALIDGDASALGEAGVKALMSLTEQVREGGFKSVLIFRSDLNWSGVACHDPTAAGQGAKAPEHTQIALNMAKVFSVPETLGLPGDQNVKTAQAKEMRVKIMRGAMSPKREAGRPSGKTSVAELMIVGTRLVMVEPGSYEFHPSDTFGFDANGIGVSNLQKLGQLHTTLLADAGISPAQLRKSSAHPEMTPLLDVVQEQLRAPK